MSATPSSSARQAVELARTLLFVPGDRPDRFAKAAACGADLVVCDLEDAVAADAKVAARAAIRDWLGAGGRAAVRINAVDTQWYAADWASLVGLDGLVAVVVPKAEDPEALASLSAELGAQVPLVALVETALGLHRAFELAAVLGVARLAFGALDFALDAGTADDDEALLYARSSLVVASRAARLSQPVDGVTVALDDPETAEQDATRARRLGFAGKLCIHPRQVQAVNAAFSPTAAEVEHARRVVVAAGGASPGAGGAATRVDGQMVDAPVLERARRVLARADLGRAPMGNA
jgi:citrate lyase subunit beta/citryl-CoA lyase